MGLEKFCVLNSNPQSGFLIWMQISHHVFVDSWTYQEDLGGDDAKDWSGIIVLKKKRKKKNQGGLVQELEKEIQEQQQLEEHKQEEEEVIVEVEAKYSRTVGCEFQTQKYLRKTCRSSKNDDESFQELQQAQIGGGQERKFQADRDSVLASSQERRRLCGGTWLRAWLPVHKLPARLRE